MDTNSSNRPPENGLTPATSSVAEPRRNDLDALRAFAMLLGIVLHVSLSFFPMFWPVQDIHRSDAFGLLFLMIHGFRMPLFFLLSGYFTMMIFRKRGLAELLRQRGKRILIPCLLGLVTVVPLMKLATGWALSRAVASAPPSLNEPLFDAIRSNDSQAVQDRIRQGDQPDQLDARFKVSALSWACLTGNAESVQVLLKAKANVNIPNGDGNTPIRAAAFAGQDKIVQLLIEHGADPISLNPDGTQAIESTNAPHELTTGILQLLGLPAPDLDQLDAGRGRVRKLLQPLSRPTPKVATAPSFGQRAATFLKSGVAAYTSFLRSDRFQIGSGARSFHLFTTSVFDHLWFLWFLCWMVVGFGIAERLGIWSEHGPLRGNRNLWLLPATILPQLLMGVDMPVFGPDTSVGLLPMPHLLVYYAIFFAFGAAHFDAREQQKTLGNRFWLLIGSSIFIVFPLGLIMLSQRIPSAILQPIYAWAVCFGLMGLFRRYLPVPNSKIRYLSDASYWMYLIHLPLVIVLQSLFQSLSWPGPLKFTLINLIAMGLLVATYQLLVRNTVIGVLLNGRRAERPPLPSPATAT